MNVIKIPDHTKACISDHCISNKKAVYTKTKEYSISIKTIEIYYKHSSATFEQVFIVCIL